MPKQFFLNFPNVDYKFKDKDLFTVTNITLRPIFRKVVRRNKLIFYPYTIQEYEKPWTIAKEYYGDEYYFWLIALANDILHLEFEWPKTDREFKNYINEKYWYKDSEISGLRWASQNIKYYKTGNGFIVDEITWNNLTGDLGENKSSQTYYNWEFEKNEELRNIQIIGKQFLSQIEKEISNEVF